jgi:hypothetical protein
MAFFAGGGEGYVPCGPPFDPVDAPHKFYNGTTAQDMTDCASPSSGKPRRLAISPPPPFIAG